jgi:vacuolar-type H+-ATPase subunit I/STV1
MMDGTVNPVSIATSISIGTLLLAGFVPLLVGLFVSFRVAMRSRKGAAVDRDPAVWILFGIALLLIVFHAIAAAVIAVRGMAYFGLLKAALLLTAAFAVVGMVVGLVRGLRSATAIKTQSA